MIILLKEIIDIQLNKHPHNFWKLDTRSERGAESAWHSANWDCKLGFKCAICSRKSVHHPAMPCLAVAMNKHRICLKKGCFFFFLPCLGQGSSLWQHAGIQFFFFLCSGLEQSPMHHPLLFQLHHCRTGKGSAPSYTKLVPIKLHCLQEHRFSLSFKRDL